MVKDPLYIVTRLSNNKLLVEQGVLNVGTDFSAESNWHYIDWFKVQADRLLEVVPLNKKDLICSVQPSEVTCLNIVTNKRLCSLTLDSPICHYCYYEYLATYLLLAIQTANRFHVYKLVYESEQPYFQMLYELLSDLISSLGKISAISMCPEFLAICTCSYANGKRNAMVTVTVIHIGDGTTVDPPAGESTTVVPEPEATDDQIKNLKAQATTTPSNLLVTTEFQISGRPKTLQFDRASQLIVVLKRSETYYFFRYKFYRELSENGIPVVRGELLSEPSTGMQYQFRSCISKHSVLYAGRYPNYVCIECRRNPKSFTFAAHCEFSSERELVSVANTPNGSFVAAIDPNRTSVDLYYNFCFCASVQLVGKNGPIPKGSKLLGCCILPESYYLLAYTTNGLMALYCIQNSSYGLFHVNEKYILPLASYAIERTRRSLLILYSTHYLYLYIKPGDDNPDELMSAMAWCPNPTHVTAYQRLFAEERGAMEITGFTTGIANNKPIINITLKFKNDESFVVTLDLEEGEFVPASLTAAIANTTARIESAKTHTVVHNTSPSNQTLKTHSVVSEDVNADPCAVDAELSKVKTDQTLESTTDILSSVPSTEVSVTNGTEIPAA